MSDHNLKRPYKFSPETARQWQILREFGFRYAEIADIYKVRSCTIFYRLASDEQKRIDAKSATC